MTIKKVTIVLFSFLVLISCTQKEDADTCEKCINTETIHSENNGAVLNLTRQEWYLQENGIHGIDVGVKLWGSIIGDSASVRTYGDGLISDFPIQLTSQKEFNKDFGIFFTSSPLSDETIIAHTLIMVYSGNDTLKVNINSCPLKNIQLKPE